VCFDQGCKCDPSRGQTANDAPAACPLARELLSHFQRRPVNIALLSSALQMSYRLQRRELDRELYINGSAGRPWSWSRSRKVGERFKQQQYNNAHNFKQSYLQNTTLCSSLCSLVPKTNLLCRRPGLTAECVIKDSTMNQASLFVGICGDRRYFWFANFEPELFTRVHPAEDQKSSLLYGA
jgi:hypothetical protein